MTIKMSIKTCESAIEGCPLSGVPLYTFHLNIYVNCKYEIVETSFKCGLYVTCHRLACALPNPIHHCV